MPRVRRVQASVQATAYPETRTVPNGQAVTADVMKAAIYQKPPPIDTWGRTRFGRSLNVDRIESALRLAQFGYMREITDLARETVATDPHLAAVLGKRINAVASLPYDIVAAEGPGIDPAKAEANAELVRIQISRINHFRQALKQLAWALFDGRGALEIQWLLRPSAQASKTGGPYPEPKQDWVAADLIFIHPRRLQFGPQRELRVSDDIATMGFQPVGIALNSLPYKFIEFKPQLFGDYPELEGLAPRCLYWSFFKRYSARDRNILMELFGKPWRVITVDETSSAGLQDLRDGEQAADQLGATNTARMPRGVKLDVVTPGETAGEVHADIIEYSDQQVSKLVLGQTGTTDAQNSGLGSNQPSVMANEQLLILQGDAELLSDAIEDYLCDAIVALNRGVNELDHAPRFILRAEMPTDRVKEAGRVKAALDAGLELSADEAYEVTGFRKPVESDATLRVVDVAGPDGISRSRAVMQAPLKPEGDDSQFGIGNIVPDTNDPSAVKPSVDPTTQPTATAGTPGAQGRFSLAPTDLASVVQVNEARASAGLGPLQLPTGAPDPDGHLTVAAYQAKHEAPKPSPFGNAPKPGGGEPPKPPGDKPPEEPPPAGSEPPKPKAPEEPAAPASKDGAPPIPEPAKPPKTPKLPEPVNVMDPGALSRRTRLATTLPPEAPETDVAEATDPKYDLGTYVEALVDHMPGMKGMKGKVSIAHAGAPPYYGVTFDGTTEVHRWLVENEIAEVPEPASGSTDSMKMDISALSLQYEQQIVLAMAGMPGTCELPGHEHHHVVALDKSVQPSTVNGTLEDIITRGVKEAARINTKWADAFVSAVRGKHTAAAIHTAILKAHESLELLPYARAVERNVSQAAMTGALDSQWESETEDQIKPEAFPTPEVAAARVGLANVDLTAPEVAITEVTSEPEFTQYSYKAALKYFTVKAPIPKSTFAKLSASMKARSFTVAGLSSDQSLQTAQQELARAIVDGSDLKDFAKRLGDRFESAGLTKLNPSHAETVFRTNVLDSYNIGRRAEMSQPAALKQRPYWLIRTVVDARQRKTHGAVNNWVLRADDPFFGKGGPPWGFSCRCRLTAIREPRALEMGVRSGAEIMNLPDEGFQPNVLVGSSLADLISP